MMNEAETDNWFSESAKCQACDFCDEGAPGSICGMYKMPLSMVKRKNKCKQFMPYDEQAELNRDFYNW